MFFDFLLVIAGFMLLIKGADYLVDGSTSIARRFGISTLIIGLTIVAFGTSAPELVVNILSATSGATDLAFANINGSNIANILLILGITSLFAVIPVKSQTVLKEIPFMLFAGMILVFIVLDVQIGGAESAMISRIDGILLLLVFAIFMYYLFLSSKKTGGATVEKPKFSLPKGVALTVAGLAGLIVGGKLAVDGAVGIALGIGVSQALVGLTVVAIGTSLPELVSAIVAAKKGETDLAIGNVVGSCIFNILLVLGATAVVNPIPISDHGVIDALFALAAMCFLFLALFLNKHGRKSKTKQIDPQTGLLFIILYVAYIVYIVIRG